MFLYVYIHLIIISLSFSLWTFFILSFLVTLLPFNLHQGLLCSSQMQHVDVFPGFTFARQASLHPCRFSRRLWHDLPGSCCRLEADTRSERWAMRDEQRSPTRWTPCANLAMASKLRAMASYSRTLGECSRHPTSITSAGNDTL